LAYIVDPRQPSAAEELGGQLVSAVRTQDLLILVSPADLIALGTDGLRWQTRRISWDGMRALCIHGNSLRGEAWVPSAKGGWLPFEVDLTTGAASGGSYDGPNP